MEVEDFRVCQFLAFYFFKGPVLPLLIDLDSLLLEVSLFCCYRLVVVKQLLI